jgi:AAA ATPase domain
MASERAAALLYEARRGNQLAASATARGLAVLGPFDPARIEGNAESEEVLALLCRPLPPRDGRRESLLRDARRVDVLAKILRESGHDGLAATRTALAQDLDSPLQRMLDAFVLDKDVPVEARGEDELIASLDVYRWATEAVARAGLTGSISVEPGRDAIEGRLALLEVTRPVRRLVEGGCVGRERELALLHAYRGAPPEGRGLSEEPAMVVFGIGGVGKSTLVAQFVKDLFDEGDGKPAQPWAYVDFDRPTLASYAPGVVLTDIVHQVAAQFPDQRRVLERSEVVEAQRDLGAGLEALDERSYLARAAEFARAVRSFGDGTLVVVLDTFEEVEREAPKQANEIHRLFAGLAGELPGLKLIVSGRSPAAAFDSTPTRGRRMPILPLDDEGALVLLRHFVAAEAERADRPALALDDDLGREVVGLVGGIPLTLRLAAEVLVHEGAGAIEDAAKRGRALTRVREQLVRGFLYHRILDHISLEYAAETRELRRVAKASIVLRWVTAELVEEVLLPTVGGEGRLPAGRLFDALADDVAFTERDGAQLRLREDLRGPALAALRIENGALVREIHTRAAAYFGKRDDDRDVLEHAYHRLALGEPVAVVAAELGDAVVQRLEPTTGDLSPASAAEIGRALRDTGAAAEASDLVTWERQVLPEAEAALQSGDLVRARALLSKRPARSAGTELHRLTSRLLEAEGKPGAAAVAARRDLHASAAASDPVRYAAAAVRLAGLQEAAARPKEADATLQEAVAAPVLSGFPKLRLELLLNRMAMRERLGLQTEDSRWSLGLEARRMLKRLDPADVNFNTALVRLLAATLGRDEPQRVRAAARLLGFGRGESPVRVEEVVRAVAAWDAAGPDPGRLAAAQGLSTGSDPESLVRAWRARLAGLGTDAAPVLDKLWEFEKPPEPVREALRDVYVWWGVKLPPPDRTAAREHHFLADVPLDWSRPETIQLEELVLTGYPTSTETLSLADRAGIDMSRIAWSQADRTISRELLAVAARTGNVDELIAAMLDDPAAVSIHGALRELVGEDWLATRLESGVTPR